MIRKNSRKYVFKLGKEIVNQTRNEILLGTIVANSKVELQRCFKKRIDICKCMLYAAQSIGSYTVPLNPIVATKIYWEACIPKLLYGLEITDIDENTMIDLEIFHFEAAKHCQGLPTNTSNYGALVTIGWKTLGAQCDIIRLLFMWRLLSLSMLCLYKRIFISRLIEIFNNDNQKCIGPTQMLVETCKKYGLLNVLKVSVMNGEYMSMCKWKKMVIESLR